MRRAGRAMASSFSTRGKIASLAVDFHDGAVPQFGPATALPVNIASDRTFVGSYSPYAVTADGRFITTQPVGRTQQTIHLVTNWNAIVGR